MLQLSSNAFEGEIAADAFTNNTRLRNVNLSRNKLFGTVPAAVFAVPFVEFDLSSNKMSGTIDTSQFTSSHASSLKLSVNRISGTIDSSSLEQIAAVDVLEGNLFRCSSHKLLLHNDPSSDKYRCGTPPRPHYCHIFT